MTLRDYIYMEKLIHKKEIPADILYQMTSDSPDEGICIIPNRKND